MRFEKWQALGNDYLIVEEVELPFPLTAGRVARLCAPHTGVGADGLLVLSASERDGFVARLRIFNPDGSESELSGNGAREAILYLRRRGWTDLDTFSIETAAGEIRPRITGPSTCTVDMGRARLRSADFPSGGDDGTGSLTAAGRAFRFQHVQVGNPQCAIEVEDGLEALDLGRYGADDRASRALPEPDQRVLLAPRRRLRGHGADLRARRRGDALLRHRRHRRRDRRRARRGATAP